jgi:hypothetical protein
MSRPCSVCTSPKRAEIDAALIAGIAHSKIAAEFGSSKASLSRHKVHLMAQISAADQQRQTEHSHILVAQVDQLRQRATNLLDVAEKAGSLAIALQAIREARSCLELLGRISGKLQDSRTVNVTVFNSPEWSRLVRKIVDSLQDFPEARQRLIQILGGASFEVAALPNPLTDADIILSE